MVNRLTAQAVCTDSSTNAHNREIDPDARLSQLIVGGTKEKSLLTFKDQAA